MKTQLTRIMHHLNLTATKFADEIGVQRSSISHIISGRNQPSYDFILKVINRFKEINAEWLLTGEGHMLKDRHEPEIHNQEKKIGKIEQKRYEYDNHGNDIVGKKTDNEINESIANKIEVTNVNNIIRIVIFFDDGTFSDYMPGRNI